MAESGTLTLPESLWAEAKRRAAVIAPLAAADVVPAAAARAAGETLGLSERTYALGTGIAVRAVFSLLSRRSPRLAGAANPGSPARPSRSSPRRSATST